MTTNSPPASSPVQRHLPRLLFAVVALPVAVFLIWYLLHRWSDASVIQRLEAKARKNGEPLTYPELAALYPPIPDNQNGAARLMDAWEKDDPMFWRLFRDGEKHLPQMKWNEIDPAVPYVGTNSPFVWRTNDIDIANLSAGEAYLRERKKHLDEIRNALSNSNFWFPIAITNGEFVLLPHLAQLKGEAPNFSLQALVSAERGDLDSAIRAVEDTAHTGNTMASEPLTVSQLVRLACYHISLRDSERLLSRRTLSAPQLIRLARLYSEIHVGQGLRLALFSERVGALDILEGAERIPIVGFFEPMQSSRRTVLMVCDQLLSLGYPYTPEVLHEFDHLYATSAKIDTDTNAPDTRTLGWSMLGDLDGVAHKLQFLKSIDEPPSPRSPWSNIESSTKEIFRCN